MVLAGVDAVAGRARLSRSKPRASQLSRLMSETAESMRPDPMCIFGLLGLECRTQVKLAVHIRLALQARLCDMFN